MEARSRDASGRMSGEEQGSRGAAGKGSRWALGGAVVARFGRRVSDG